MPAARALQSARDRKAASRIKYVAAAAVKSKCGANMSATGGVQGMSLEIKTRARAPGQHDATSSCLPACARACGERARVTIHTHSRAHVCQSRATHSQSRRALTQARHDAINTYTGARAHLQKARLRQSAHARAWRRCSRLLRARRSNSKRTAKQNTRKAQARQKTIQSSLRRKPHKRTQTPSL